MLQGEQKKSYLREYHILNAEKIRKKAREYYRKNREKILRLAKLKYAQNPEPYKVKSKAWKSLNRDRANELERRRVEKDRSAENARKLAWLHQKLAEDPQYSKRKRQAYYNSEDGRKKIKEYTQEYRRNNPEWYKLQKHKRRKWLESGHFTPTELKEKLVLQNYQCVYCLCDLTKKYSIEHIVPLCRGGANTINNIDLTCLACNLKKGRKTKDEYLSAGCRANEVIGYGEMSKR